MLELDLGGSVYFCALAKHLSVEIKLFFVKTINSLHVLHALLENLHFLLELDFLVGLIVGVVGPDLLKASILLILFLVAPLLVVVFCFFVQSKQTGDLVSVTF